MIIVTGGNGQLGRQIVGALRDLIGTNFIVTVRDTAKAADLAAQGIKVRAGDFDKPDEIARALEDGTTLLMMATIAPQDQRVKQYKTATDAAKKAGVKRIAFLGYLADQKDSPFPSAMSIHAALADLKQQGYAPINLRCGNYAEAGLSTAQRAVETGKIVLPAGNGKISYVTRRDLGRAIAKVLSEPGHEGRDLALSGPAAYSYTELAEFLTKTTGKKITYDAVSAEQYEADLKKANTPAGFVPFLTASAETTRRGLLAEVSTTIKDLTGKPPEDGLEFIARALKK